ncbi:unnamed protein product [Linum tenue]|uniref:Methyltransferase-related protein n=1 Tax=Linum tenue TaxID=586396 RepID=A0AAV0IPD4_9ROSI|nr:unnamed protein product [Linum tenue]
MCPLRIILVFLSATLAGFFLVRNLNSPQTAPLPDDLRDSDDSSPAADDSATRFSKVRSAVESGFWTCVDMASGRYLWRHLTSSSSSPKPSSSSD